MLKSFIKRAGENGGLYIKKIEGLPRGMDWVLDLGRAWGGRQPRVIFDVGANVGQTARYLKGKFPGAVVHSFEPVGPTFASLSKAVDGLEGVHCHHVALSDREGKLEIATIPNSLYASLSSDFVAKQQDAVIEEIALTTVDAFCRERGIGRVDVLKTDTEGHDLEVLKGAAGMLEAGKIGAVYSEVTFSPENTQNTLFSNLFGLLDARGFRFLGLYELEYFHTKPWNTSFCNALFVRGFGPDRETR